MRTKNMNSFIVMDIVREAEKFVDAIHFEIGQPDLPPSPKVKLALHDAIEKECFSYTQSHGLYELREKIAKMYKEKYSVDVACEQIFLTPGTSGAFLIAYALTLGHACRLGLSDPSYPCYKNFAHMLDIEPVFMPIDKDDGYQLRVAHLKKHQMDALQISSPANPTGNIYESGNLQELIGYSQQNSIAFISDELYHGLSYEQEASSALQFSDEVYVINGFSKYYCMPGQRLGWIVVPKHKIRAAEIVAQNLFISAPTLSQYGCLEAFDDEYLSSVKDIFKERRDYLFSELSDIFSIDAKPQGAFYIWANVSEYSNDSFAFAKELLENVHVAATPGRDFGANKTEQYLRFAYTRNIDHMRQGVQRVRSYLAKRA